MLGEVLAIGNVTFRAELYGSGLINCLLKWLFMKFCSIHLSKMHLIVLINVHHRVDLLESLSELMLVHLVFDSV